MTVFEKTPGSGLSRAELELIQTGLNNIDQGVTIFDRDLRLVFVNKKLRDLLDLPDHIARRGANFEEIIRYNALRGEYGPGDPDQMAKERVALARQFRSHSIERTRTDGTVLRINGWPLPSGGFATIYTDITRQRQRELSLQTALDQHSEDLKRNEERFRLIANELPAGIAYVDRGQVFQFANSRFAKAYQLTPDRIVGMPCDRVLSPETMRVVWPHFEVAQAGEPVDFDFTLTLPDGRVQEVRTFLRPDSSGNGFYLMSVNVTKHKHAAALMLQAQKMDALGQLSSGVAHDFNNLLMVILGNLTPLADRIDPALNEELLAPAIGAARRGADLTRRLLAVARRQPLEPAAVDLAEVARNLGTLVARGLPEGVDLAVISEEGPVWAFVDRAQLETVLLNLTVNARDAIDREGQISIRLTPRMLGRREAETLGLAPGGYVEVRFSDTGVGIPPEILRRVFEPFFSTKREAQGSGLGLALAYSFMQESGGHIEIESAPGAGTTVRLLLPAATPEEPARSEAGTSGIELDGKLVLLVDDDENIRMVLRRDLRDLGLHVVEAGSAQEALEMAAILETIDLVLTDIAMPGAMNGFDLEARLRALYPALPVLLMTGHGVEALQRDARILQKPFDREALRAALRLSEASG